MSGNFGEHRTPVEGIKQSLLESQLNLQHPLVKLAKALDWQYFEQELRTATTTDVGRPALSSRLLVGLHYLKALYDESDESVVEKWLENPYWQYFCGEQTFQHELPCHPTSLVKWRQRVGAEGVEKLLKGLLKTAFQQQALKPSEIEKVNVDTTVQEKAIAFPTDARLYDKARRALVRAADKQQIKLRQSYSHLGKQALFRQSRYAVAQQGSRARKQTQKLRTYLGRVIRDIERKLSNPSPMLVSLLQRTKRIYQQKRNDSRKLYSVHAPEVECIAKGKVNKKYEFGCKVAVVTTHCSNWIVGIDAQHGNPYDGATLAPALLQVENLTQVKPQQAIVDQGFRGSTYHPQGVQVLITGNRKPGGFLRRLLKRRSAIEPIIGHTKHDHRMQRNYLQGQIGDRINSFLAGCGFNLRKLYRFFMTAPLRNLVA
ncbi:transposase [Nostoc minutum NIES-26]|uniref:Transposase n=1 Tax=Nostoc minutum NIES-26 TaxID=1844469 RepID=A0A367R9C9_9NOSO|nr:transposase [Nostoc minutum NIES-26]